MKMKEYAIVRILHHVFNAVGIYLLWIVLHYACSHLYVYYCTPMSFVGFITSPLVVPLPHCHAFRWIIYNGGNSITNMWIILGLWVTKHLVVITVKSTFSSTKIEN